MIGAPLVFESEAVALHLVAGIPCAARGVIELTARGAIADDAHVVLAAAGGWPHAASLEAEFERVAPNIAVEFAPLEAVTADKVFDGVAAVAGDQKQRPISITDLPHRTASETRAVLAAAGRRIIAGTGKATDGLVSQWINRPISRFLSFHCLKLGWMRPLHATVAAALFGLAMAVCLFCGGQGGLIAGAILYQIASIVDGVDGEVARATLRSSKWGATLDTASDALTNFAFISGVCFNIWQQGEQTAALAGLVGLASLMIGLAVFGAQSLRAGGPLRVDTIKQDAQASGSRLFKAAAKLASRDVYALLLVALIVIGLAGPAMIFFGAAATIWLVAITIMLARKLSSP
ncbi:CDP-alcohol phosphatidyltransferase family protein [uncultured Erythrobacter sp.]|uniref:CDP-alcohol phosphatidyltransferase family protein n=1 Tax=uncultured Erythrobacter sp. TaxID=263913 RepID=UPI0026388E3F|nr:CDP-alcohol phosphatidyltransferase family protein [uncultured Erythrobacter sp.]